MMVSTFSMPLFPHASAGLDAAARAVLLIILLSSLLTFYDLCVRFNPGPIGDQGNGSTQF